MSMDRRIDGKAIYHVDGVVNGGNYKGRASGIAFAATTLVAGLCIALLGAPAARAQVAPLPTPPGFEPPSGMSFNEFEYYVRLQAGLKSTTNVRLDPTEEGDIKKLAAINAVARSKWKKHALAVTLGFIESKALATSDQKQDAKSGTLSGRYDFSEKLNFEFGVSRNESIIGKNSPLQFSGSLNGTTQIKTYEGAFKWDDKVNFLNVFARFQDVLNVTDIDVTVLSRLQSQDREEHNQTLEVGRYVDWGKVYLYGGPQRVTYTGSDFLLPEDRDSTGGRLGFGADFKNGNLQGQIRIIGFGQYFDAPTINDIESVVGKAQITRKIDDKWSTAAVVERNFEETNIETSGGLYTNLAGVGVVYAAWKDAYVKIGPTYRFYQIDGTRYKAKSFTLDTTAAWQIHERAELLFNSSISNQTANDVFLAEQVYSEASATLSLVVSF